MSRRNISTRFIPEKDYNSGRVSQNLIFQKQSTFINLSEANQRLWSPRSQTSSRKSNPSLVALENRLEFSMCFKKENNFHPYFLQTSVDKISKSVATCP